MVRQIGGRARPHDIEAAIKALCAWQPLTQRQIAAILDRNPVYVQHRFLTPMLHAGVLEYIYPDIPAHPLQGYKAAQKPQDGKDD